MIMMERTLCSPESGLCPLLSSPPWRCHWRDVRRPRTTAAGLQLLDGLSLFK
ncbi:hypothetical protein Hanom_Chr15g01383981 [Helianthus anomalus]